MTKAQNLDLLTKIGSKLLGLKTYPYGNHINTTSMFYSTPCYKISVLLYMNECATEIIIVMVISFNQIFLSPCKLHTKNGNLPKICTSFQLSSHNNTVMSRKHYIHCFPPPTSLLSGPSNTSEAVQTPSKRVPGHTEVECLYQLGFPVMFESNTSQSPLHFLETVLSIFSFLEFPLFKAENTDS